VPSPGRAVIARTLFQKARLSKACIPPSVSIEVVIRGGQSCLLDVLLCADVSGSILQFFKVTGSATRAPAAREQATRRPQHGCNRHDADCCSADALAGVRRA
jgi:hypothetical protein